MAIEVAPGPNWHSLYRWVVSQAAEFLAFQTVYLITDKVANTPGSGHWPMVAAWWNGTYILDACVFLFPAINFALIDSDCVPVTLFEIQELWLSCIGHDHSAEWCLQPEPMPSS